MHSFECAKYEEFFKILDSGPNTVRPATVGQATQGRRQARTKRAKYLFECSKSPGLHALIEFCALVDGGEHDIPASDVEAAKETLRSRATPAALESLRWAQTNFQMAIDNNFAKPRSNAKSSPESPLDLAVSNYRSFLKYVACGANVPSNDVENARIALAMALFALQRYGEALAEATTFTTECPEHKRPMVPNAPITHARYSPVGRTWFMYAPIAVDDTGAPQEHLRQGRCL
jgi:hypothetical protein